MQRREKTCKLYIWRRFLPLGERGFRRARFKGNNPVLKEDNPLCHGSVFYVSGAACSFPWPRGERPGLRPFARGARGTTWLRPTPRPSSSSSRGGAAEAAAETPGAVRPVGLTIAGQEARARDPRVPAGLAFSPLEALAPGPRLYYHLNCHLVGIHAGARRPPWRSGPWTKPQNLLP